MAAIKILQLSLQSVLLILYLSFPGFGIETDTINSTFSFKDPDFIVSRNPVFKLGFFSPDNTTNRYLAIFYVVSERNVIWIANRDTPLTDSSGTVTVSADGNLILKNGRNDTVWSTNATNTPYNATATLEETGNLVLRDIRTGNVTWESFSHPSQVFVPTMKLVDDTNTGEKVALSSWKNSTDPAVGRFTLGLRALIVPEMIIWRDGLTYWRSGPWNGLAFLGIHYTYSLYNDQHRIVNESGVYYITTHERRFLMKYDLNSTGGLEQTMWNDQTKRWDSIWIAMQNECDVYEKCGPFSSCNVADSPVCSCLRGFEPSDEEEWQKGNWSGGCVRKKQLRCDPSDNSTGKGDGFLRLQSMKVPDFAEKYAAGHVDECRGICLRNCSCVAYAHDSNIGCMIWTRGLVDIQQLSGPRPDLYIRLSASELDDSKDKKLVIIIPVIAGVVCITICVVLVWCWIGRKKGEYKKEQQKTSEARQTISSDSAAMVLKDESEKVDIKELPLFTFDTLANATNQFHDNNLLGRGGFGSVYMGKLADGKEIAVKRLSAASAQGLQEFMNEVVLISKLQHRNLVRLIGCCVEREEKMLIYEYMPNKSLDVCLLFEPGQPSQKILDWEKRFSIIEGIGRGLLYLHRDSRLRIIHRDLKPSNVLLDDDWNPKISDFGMARIFGGDEDQANTARVVGTYGYMAPEYAMEGMFSEKSDVYSFGVLMLEIVSGKKNTQYYNHEWSLSLLGCAWKLWNEQNGMAFVDQTIASPNFHDVMVRCIHIGLLCIQEFPKDRPTIQTVLSMLSYEITDLPLPEQPVFAEKWNRFHAGSTQSTNLNEQSVNELTITMLDGR